MNTDAACLLVVDDNEMNRDLLTRRLRRQGHDVVTAVNGVDALQQLETRYFDLILLDIMMPEMNGFEVLERLKKHEKWQYIPVIVISAADDMENIVRGIELGAEDYLNKPFNPMLLKARIQASLEKKRLVDKEQARIAELSTMQQIDAELNATLDLRRVLEITLEWAMRQSGAEAGLMGVVLGKQVNVQAVDGYTYEVTADGQYLILPDEMPAMQAACHTRQMAYIPDTKGAGLLARTHSQIAVPLQRDEQVVAMLLLESTEKNHWEEDTLTFLRRLCAHAAIAVANAQLYEAVQLANNAKTEFVSFVSHELKSPMTSIHGYTELLLSGNYGQTNDTQSQFLKTVKSNVDRMRRLVSDLEDVSRIETGHLELHTTAVALDELVHDVMDSIQSQIEAKSQTLKLNIAHDLPGVWGDPTRLMQILTNLISNATKYTPENGRITISARPSSQMNGSQKPKKMIHVAVADTGLGIKEEDQAGIFRKFFRADDEEAHKLPGTGLGLNITKNLVEMHNGRIWFESTYREGTTFHVMIPAVTEEQATAEEKLEAIPSLAISASQQSLSA